MRLSGVSGVRGVCGMAALLTCFATCAVARTLTLAVGAPVTSIDPHYHNLTPNERRQHIFDRLVDRDPERGRRSRASRRELEAGRRPTPGSSGCAT